MPLFISNAEFVCMVLATCNRSTGILVKSTELNLDGLTSVNVHFFKKKALSDSYEQILKNIESMNILYSSTHHCLSHI